MASATHFPRERSLWVAGRPACRPEARRSGRRIGLKQADVEALSELGSLKLISPEYMQSLPITYGLRQTTAGVRGVAPEYAVMRSETAEFGRFLNHEDVENHRRVAFLGYEVARRLFSNIPPVGEDDPHQRRVVRGRSASCRTRLRSRTISIRTNCLCSFPTPSTCAGICRQHSVPGDDP